MKIPLTQKTWPIAFLLLLFGCIQMQAQTITYEENTSLLKEDQPSLRIGIITNGILKNPGLNLSYQKPIISKLKDKSKRKIKSINLNTNLGFYWDPKTHIATYATAGLNYRKTNRKNRQWMIALNPLGYMRTFVHEAYEVDDNLEVTRKRLAGRSYYAPEIIIGTGKITKEKCRYFNVHLMLIGKHNLAALPLLHFEFGYRL